MHKLGFPVSEMSLQHVDDMFRMHRQTFLYAPNYHKSLTILAPIRKSLPFPTIFNLLGPLINPARPTHMLVGVHSGYLGLPIAQALQLLHVQSAMVVCGEEGLDELSPSGCTYVWRVSHAYLTQYRRIHSASHPRLWHTMS